MFAPKLYSTYKYDYRTLKADGFRLDLSPTALDEYRINQADNLLFHHIRRILKARDLNTDLCGRYVAFVNCKGSAQDEEGLSELILNGFWVNGEHFVLGERSASMTRNSILSFLSASIADEVAEVVTMGAQPGTTVISKLMAYRGLCLSSCHCLEGYTPKVIVVDDYECVLPKQHIKYVYDRETSFVNDQGETVPWTQKDVTDGYRDIKVTPFDGCGIHHPAITEEVAMRLGAADDDQPTTILWRGSYIKGLTCEIDYPAFYASRGVTHIKDVWGVEHDVTYDAEPMIILSMSMYKGFWYFALTKTSADWDYYWEQFHKYGHCLGVAKWNFNQATEPVYTRCNYQVLQTLNMPYEDFIHLADKSAEWAERIIDGDPLYTMCFLGLTADRHDALNDYTRAVLKNPEMLYERTVRNYLISLLSKYIDEMKCGKIWIKSCFKFLLPDMIAFMEHAAGLDVVGCIGDGEFFCLGKDGPMLGDKLITRNPHICDSENVILRAVTNDLTSSYLSHLVNTCIINSRSLIPQRLNGADWLGGIH